MPKKPDLNPIDIGEETIGQRIARIRKNKKMTQNELAKKIGISRSALSDYERGRLKLYDDLIIRIAIHLEISADIILGLKSQDQQIEDQQYPPPSPPQRHSSH